MLISVILFVFYSYARALTLPLTSRVDHMTKTTDAAPIFLSASFEFQTFLKFLIRVFASARLPKQLHPFLSWWILFFTI